MAERNPRIPHSIESLLFVNRNGKYCGYKQELISDNISADLREFLICAECEGISRKPRQRKWNTVCEMCVPEEHRNIGDIDERVENKVAFLNARCPLSGEGCGWEGKLKEIEQHMEECDKVRVECQLECGNVLERESIEQHNREICPLRLIQCIYCNQEIQANEENPHIGRCRNHPDTEVPCPYKELGCEAIVLRKNMNIHITENITNHQEIMLYQLNQLRNRDDQLEKVNEQQRDRITAIETSATEKERKELAAQKSKARRRWRVWVILALVAVGIGGILAFAAVGIGVTLAAMIGIALGIAFQGNNIKTNSEQITYNSEQIKFISARIAVNSDQIDFNSQQAKYNLQLIVTLLSNAGYIYKYIEERGKVLSGIEWIYNVEKIGTFYGPTFTLEQCKLRLKAVVTSYYRTTKRARNYVERLKGEYDDTIGTCRITYSYSSFWYLEATQPEETDSDHSNTELKVGDSRNIGYMYWEYTNPKVIVRVYFDTFGT